MQKVVIENGRTIYVDLTPEEEAARLLESEQNTPTAEELARELAIQDAPLTARGWFQQNPQAKLIFSMSVVDIVTEISNLVEASLPLVSVANRTRWKLLLVAVVLVVRIYVKERRLD